MIHSKNVHYDSFNFAKSSYSLRNIQFLRGKETRGFIMVQKAYYF